MVETSILSSQTTIYGKDMAASSVVDGSQPQQKYYFDGTRPIAPKKHTLVWMVDWIQLREAVILQGNGVQDDRKLTLNCPK